MLFIYLSLSNQSFALQVVMAGPLKQKTPTHGSPLPPATWASFALPPSIPSTTPSVGKIHSGTPTPRQGHHNLHTCSHLPEPTPSASIGQQPGPVPCIVETLSPEKLTQCIIPDEDPQWVIETAENDYEGCDDEDGVVGDGLGEEDEVSDEGDEADDEDVQQDGNNLLRMKSTRRPLPKWLLKPFKAQVAESSAPHCDANGLPPLYSNHKTFWFPHPLTFFFLNPASTTTTPQDLFNPQFFLWDPDALCPRGIPCPNCGTVLQRHQVISQPRQCVDFDQTFWIIGYRY